MNIVSACIIGMLAGGLGIFFVAQYMVTAAITSFRTNAEAFDLFCKENGLGAPPRRQQGSIPHICSDMPHGIVEPPACLTCNGKRDDKFYRTMVEKHPMKMPKFCEGCGMQEPKSCDVCHRPRLLMIPINDDVRYCVDCGLPRA